MLESFIAAWAWRSESLNMEQNARGPSALPWYVAAMFACYVVMLQARNIVCIS